MASASDAREWAASGGLHGIGDSLYTPFSGPAGDEIDWDAYRALVKYCVGSLGHEMLWLTSGIAEWSSLTISERKRLLEVAVEEARTIAPNTVIQACTSANSAKDALDLTLHAQEHGADICFLQTPSLEVHAGDGILRYFEYVASRTDIALGMFNTPSSGYIMSAADMAEIYRCVPAVVAVKDGVQDSIARTPALHSMAPGLVIWECDLIVYRAGWLQSGIVGPAQLGTAGYIYETPDRRWYSEYFHHIWAGRLAEAIAYAKDSGLDDFLAALGAVGTKYPKRPDYHTHWGEFFKYAASVIGLPVGDYMHSRPPQAILPDDTKDRIRSALEGAGMVGKAALVSI